MKYDKEKEDEYTIEDYEIFKADHIAQKESGEALLEAMLKVPFKNQKKVDDLLSKIDDHKVLISHFRDKIYKLKAKEESFFVGHTWISGSSNVVWSGTGNISVGYNSIINQQGISLPLDGKIETTEIKYVDNENQIKTVEVMDDVFQSVLGNYYLTYIDGYKIPLTRVIYIDEESSVGKWFATMCKNFERGSKLERILKDEDNQEDS